MIRLSVGKVMDTTTSRLVRELPGALRRALEDAEGPLEEAASAGMGDVLPRADGSPALLGLRDNLHAEVRDGRRGPSLVLTGRGVDERGVSYARVLNVHAHGVRVVSKAAIARKREAKAREREARAAERERKRALRSPKAQARAEMRKQEKATAKARAAAARDMRLMRGDTEEHAKVRAKEAAAAARRSARVMVKKVDAWRIPPRNPMASMARAFEQELLNIIIERIKQRWR